MFIKKHCPVCGTEVYHDIRLSALEYMRFEGENQACKYIIENIEVKDSLPEEDFVRSVLNELQKIVHNGIEIEVLIEILQDNYGVTSTCCTDLVEKIQLELGIVLSR
jgi:hypothetical protein